MRKYSFKKEVYTGTIIDMDEFGIVRASIDNDPYNNMLAFKMNEYNDFHDLVVGKKFAIYWYGFGDNFSFENRAFWGLMNLNKFNNLIRDSQMIPEGWIIEPYYILEETYGTIKDVSYDENMYEKITIVPNGDYSPSPITINMGECLNRCSSHAIGAPVVFVNTKVVTPYGKEKYVGSTLYSPKIYNNYIDSCEKVEQETKKENQQCRR